MTQVMPIDVPDLSFGFTEFLFYAQQLRDQHGNAWRDKYNEELEAELPLVGLLARTVVNDLNAGRTILPEYVRNIIAYCSEMIRAGRISEIQKEVLDWFLSANDKIAQGQGLDTAFYLTASRGRPVGSTSHAPEKICLFVEIQRRKGGKYDSAIADAADKFNLSEARVKQIALGHKIPENTSAELLEDLFVNGLPKSFLPEN